MKKNKFYPHEAALETPLNGCEDDLLSDNLIDPVLRDKLIADIHPDLRMDLDELHHEKQINSRSTANPRGAYFYCPHEFVPYFEAIFSGMGSPGSRKVVWRELLWTYGKCRLVLIEVKNPLRKTSWLGLFNIHEVCWNAEKLLYLICADPRNGMHLDFALYGCGEFELSVIGLYRDKVMAMDYRDFLINRRLDKGWTSYNMDEIRRGTVRRFISVVIDFKLMEALIENCRSSGKKFNKIVSKLVLAWLKTRT